MAGEYITELEALQVVAGDVLKENRRVRLVGEAEDAFLPDDRYDINDFCNDIQELWHRFRLDIEIDEEGVPQRWELDGGREAYVRIVDYKFVNPVIIPRSAISNWHHLEKIKSDYVEIRRGGGVGFFYIDDKTVRFNIVLSAYVDGEEGEIANMDFDKTFSEDETPAYMELAKLIKSVRDFLIKNEAPRGSIARVIPGDQTDNSEEPGSTDSGSSSGGLAGRVQKMLVDDILTNFKSNNYPVRFMGINEVEGSDYFGYDFVCNPIDGSKVLGTDEDVRLYVLRLLIAPSSTRFGWYLMGQVFSGDNPTGDERSIELHDFGSNAASSFGDFIKLNDAAMKPMIEKLKKMPPYED